MLDQIDLAILTALQDNARITNQALSDQIGLSPSPCLQRVRKLEQDGVIGGYYGRIELNRIARTVTVIATISLASHEKEEFADFEKAVAGNPDIVECFKVSGPFDYQLRFVCGDMDGYMRASDTLITDGPADMKISSHVVMQETKPFRGYPLQRLTTA